MNPYTYRERGRQTLCPSTQLTTHSCRITSTHNFLQFFYEIDKLCTTVNTINASYYLILQFNQNFHSGRPKSKILNQKIRTGPLNMPSKHGLLQKKKFFLTNPQHSIVLVTHGVCPVWWWAACWTWQTGWEGEPSGWVRREPAGEGAPSDPCRGEEGFSSVLYSILHVYWQNI